MAFYAGVLFKYIDKLTPEVQDEFKKDDKELREAFNAYLQAVPKKSGPIVLHKHKNKQMLSLCKQTIKAAWGNSSPLPTAVQKFFDLYGTIALHISILTPAA